MAQFFYLIEREVSAQYSMGFSNNKSFWNMKKLSPPNLYPNPHDNKVLLSMKKDTKLPSDQ